MRLGPALRVSVSVIFLLGTALSIYNMHSDNSALVQEAEQLACRGRCIRLIRMERSPFAQSFTFQTSIERQTTTTLQCQRELVLLGEYHCTVAPSP
jgi:hypothetical protein